MYLIFDTETTGLPQNWKAPLTDFNNWPRMVQLAWQMHDNKGELIAVKNYIIKPQGYDIPYNAEQIHGISTERAYKQGVDLKFVLQEFAKDVLSSQFVVGHNVEFDNNIVGCELLRNSLDNILYTPNGILHREMTKNAFHNLLHPFQPFICGQRIIGPTMAKKFGIKLVMYGENQAEYGNAIEENTNPIMNMDYFSSDNVLNMKFGGVTMKEYLDSGKYTKNDFAPYIAPNKNSLIDAGVEVHYLGYYLKWDPQE